MNGVYMEKEAYWEFLQKQSGELWDEADIEDANCILAFQLGQALFGIACAEIAEVVRYKDVVIQSVPRTKTGVLGIFNLRGEVIPVVDFEVMWNRVTDQTTTSSDQRRHKRIIIVNVNGIQAGILVSGVLGLYSVDLTKTQPSDCREFSAFVYAEGKYFKQLELAAWL